MKNLKLGLDIIGREYLGIDQTEVEEIRPIMFEGYQFNGAKMFRQDYRDKIYRTDIYEKAVIFFTKNELHMYKVSLNAIEEKKTETTNVYFYEDIVSVSTEQEFYKHYNQNIEYMSFKLTTRGGNAASVALKGNNDIQRSVNAMRAMIKEKKAKA